jgi:hypothetical protein
MAKNTISYALSTLAQTCAALAAFIGAVSLCCNSLMSPRLHTCGHRRARCMRRGSQEQATHEVSGATDCGVHTGLHGKPALNLLPSTMLHRVC